MYIALIYLLGIKESRFVDQYDIIADTIMLTADTMMLLLTVTKNGEQVYDEVRYVVLCPDWMVEGKEWYRREDMSN